MSAQKRKGAGERFTEVRNAKALRDYAIEDRFEAGIALRGTEVKSIRAGRAQINDAFGRWQGGELWLMNAHIEEWAFGNIHNHSPKRNRKLLMHKHQLRKLVQAVEQSGKSIVPLRMYFKQALVKVEIGIGTGKKLYDKRADLRSKVVDREVERELKPSR